MMYEIMTPAEAKALGGLTLAFFGDSVYEVYVREQIVKLGTMPVDKMKFGQAVLSGQSLRLSTKLESLANLRGAVKAEIRFTMDIKETGKKALEGTAIFIYYFN